MYVDFTAVRGGRERERESARFVGSGRTVKVRRV